MRPHDSYRTPAPTSRAVRRAAGLLVASGLALGLALAPAAPSMAATFTVTTTADSGPGSLRQAMTDARSTPGTHTIAFAIPGDGPHVITAASALPSLGTTNSTVSLDGCTQPGTGCAPDSVPSPRVQIDGSEILVPKSPGAATIRGLSLTGSPAAITSARTAFNGSFHYSDGLTVEHNLIGLAPDGTVDATPVGFRCRNTVDSTPGPADVTISRNVFGGTTTAVSCANTNPFGPGGVTARLVVANNLFGVDPSGTAARPNGTSIAVGATADARITGNLVANGTGTAVVVSRVNTRLRIDGNEIRGNAVDGVHLLGAAGVGAFAGPVTITDNAITGNGRHGVFASAGAVDVTVGGTAADGNTISGNGGDGVAVGASSTDSTARVAVRGNRISGNGGLGIDLGDDGVTENGPAGAPRAGPNTRVNFPVLERIERGSTRVIGSYSGVANATVTLDFFVSAARDGSGYGEGGTPLGSTEVTTDAAGGSTFDVTFAPTIAEGAVVTATATNAAGSTSEFSAALSVGPTATEDRAPTRPDTAVTIHPASDDEPGDAPLDPASTRLIDPDSGARITDLTLDEGRLTVGADGSVTFTPAAGSAGISAQVRYSVADTTGARSAPATITLVIGPLAADDAAATAYRTSVDGDAADGDESAPGSTFRATSEPEHGTVVVDEDGAFRYTPAAGYAGADRFGYEVCAPAPEVALCDAGLVEVTVAAPALTAADRDQEASTAGGVAGNIIGAGTVDGAESTSADVVASAIDAPTGLSIEPGGDVRVAPGIAAGSYEFRYRLCLTDDPTTCATARIAVLVSAADPDAPTDEPTGGSAAEPAGGLPTTGSDPLPLLAGAICVLLVGLLIGSGARRRGHARVE